MKKFHKKRVQEAGKHLFRYYIGRTTFYVDTHGVISSCGRCDTSQDCEEAAAAAFAPKVRLYLLERWHTAPSSLSSPWREEDLALRGGAPAHKFYASEQNPVFYVGDVCLSWWGQGLGGDSPCDVIDSFLKTVD